MSDWLTLKNMLGLTLRPIDVWPGKLRASWEREKAPYSASLKDTLGLLRTELSFLRATEIILQIALRERDLRLDGLPRAGATSEHPGVILSFQTKHGARRRAFDRFTRWEYNLRALAMNLYHLRAANLYGVEVDEQQYTGWKAISSGDKPAFDLQTANDAAAFLGRLVSAVPSALLSDKAAFTAAYREAVKEHHPDAGGSHETFILIQQAADLLKARHGQ